MYKFHVANRLSNALLELLFAYTNTCHIVYVCICICIWWYLIVFTHQFVIPKVSIPMRNLIVWTITCYILVISSWVFIAVECMGKTYVLVGSSFPEKENVFFFNSLKRSLATDFLNHVYTYMDYRLSLHENWDIGHQSQVYNIISNKFDKVLHVA